MDGFEDLGFTFDSFETLGSVAEPSETGNRSTAHDMIYKGAGQGLLPTLLGIIQCISSAENPGGTQAFLEYLLLFTQGKRNMRKDAVGVSNLDTRERTIYERILRDLAQYNRKERVLHFINHKDITKRLINYFVVHYILVQHKTAYYLDKRTYPFTIIGQFNDPANPEALALIEQGANVVWINLHQEYKTSKNKKNRRNMHAPYARSASVEGELRHYALCELNFYIWLDDMGGFEAFFRLESDVRDKKARYDEDKRTLEQNSIGKKRKKKKIVLKDTDGQNYKTFIVKCAKPPPFSTLGTKGPVDKLWFVPTPRIICTT